MNIIYNISIWLYLMVMHVLSLFNHKAKLWIEGRKEIFSELKKFKRIKILFGFIARPWRIRMTKPMIQAYRLKFQNIKYF